MNTLANGNMCKRRKVFSFNSELYKVTGVQKVLMDIHHAVKEDYDAIIVGTVSYGMVDKSHQIFEDEYKQFKNPFMFYDSIVVFEGGNLAASKIRNLECPSYEICLIDYGCGKFNRKIHIMEQYP